MIFIERRQYKIIKEHLARVTSHIIFVKIETKKKEIETEHHLKQITERQIGRLQNKMTKQQKIMIEQQERLNDVHNSIYRGNERLDKYKIEMKGLEQWVLAARQQEEDSLTMEKYKKGDEAKIKELNLQIEKLTVMLVEDKMNQIEKLQIHKLLKLNQIKQLKNLEDNIMNAINYFNNEEFKQLDTQIKANQQELENRKSQLMNEKQENKSDEVQNQQLERTIIQQIQSDIELAIDNLKINSLILLLIYKIREIDWLKCHKTFKLKNKD